MERCKGLQILYYFVVTVLEREDDGTLTHVSAFKTKHVLDNIEMTPDGKLSGGTVPLVHTCEAICGHAKMLAATRTVAGRTVGCGKAPGGLLSIT